MTEQELWDETDAYVRRALRSLGGEMPHEVEINRAVHKVYAAMKFLVIPIRPLERKDDRSD